LRGLGRLAFAAGVGAIVTAPITAHAQEEDRGTGAVPTGGSGAIVKPAEEAPKGPVIVPPQPTRFVEPPFPEAARAARIESARVKLKVTVDKEGQVTAVEVLEGAGYGFDEAATDAVRSAEWSPATRDGKPIPAVTSIVYEFRAPAPAPAPEPPPPMPTTGELRGQLRIADSDTPLAGAVVSITGPDGKQYEVTTDAEGRWLAAGLSAGAYRVSVAAAGFDPVANSEEVAAGEITELTYRLATKAEGIEIVVQGERPPREVTRRTVGRREVDRIAGTRGDAIRSIENLPGVARPPGIAGLLIVRGSAPNDTQTFVDGAGVPIIYHFGGLSSVIPTELLDKIDFYPGNFSTRYGRVMGGIVDVGLRSPNTKCNGPYGKPSDKTGCFHGLAQFDLIDGRFLLEGPLPIKDWSFIVAARRSWFDVWLKPVLEETGAGVTSAPVYYDYQAVAETKPSPDSKLSLRGFGSDDRLELLVRDPAASDPGFGGNVRFGTASHLGQVIYTDKLSRDVDLYTMVSAGKQSLEFGIGTFFFTLDSYPVTYRSEIGWKIARTARVNFGLDFLLLPFEVAVRFPSPPDEGQPDPGPFSNKPPLEQDVSGVGFRPGWYVEGELTPTKRLRVVPGLRADYARDTSSGDFSPRINARYDVVSPTEDGTPERPARRTTVKAGAGYFYQPPEFQETDEVFGTPNLRSNRALHYGVGVEQELTRNIEVGVEGFYKDMDRLVVAQPTGVGQAYSNDGLGSVIGLETLLKYKPDRRFFGWLAYTLSRSVRQDNEQAEERLFEFDQTHILTVLGSYRLGRGWEAGGRFRVVSGNLYTPVASVPAITSIYAADAGSYVPVQGEPNSERLPVFHALDIRVDKRWQFKDWRFSAYLDVQNAYNNPAVEAVVYNYNFSQSTFQTGVPIIPSLGVRGEF
jgi:TonB family protein